MLRFIKNLMIQTICIKSKNDIVIMSFSQLVFCYFVQSFKLFLWGCCIKEQFYLPCKAHYMNRIKGVNEAIYVPDAYNSVILNRKLFPI